MAVSAITSFLNYLHPPKPGQNESNRLEVKSVPGLMTLLDVALLQSVEGELTATICSSHALLKAILDLKDQAQRALHELQKSEFSTDVETPKRNALAESFARACLEAASDTIERLSTEKLSQSANLSDPFDSTAGGSSSSNYSSTVNFVSGVGAQGVETGVLEGKEETGRRIPLQRRADCWESPRLHCPDNVWADDSFLTCQRLIRNLNKHPFAVEVDAPVLTGFVNSNGAPMGAGNQGGLSRRLLRGETDRQTKILLKLIQNDLPVRLYQFRAAMEADAVVTKRLYLVKCEYRAPFRAFLEAHQSAYRAPSLDLVHRYLSLSAPEALEAKEQAKVNLQALLETSELVESLELEKLCEEMEINMGRALFAFSELARILDHKRARIKPVDGILDAEQLPHLQETIRRLKCILCRKSGPETSAGIRPLLLDLQGVNRDDDFSTDDRSYSEKNEAASIVEKRLDVLIEELKIMGSLSKARHAFKTDKKSDADLLPAAVVKGCTDFDDELFRCHFLDWHDMVQRQFELRQVTNDDGTSKLTSLAEKIRKAEMEMSIAVASEQALGVIRQRLEQIATDRQKRFEVLKEMVEDVCLREMCLHIDLQIPDSHKLMKLSPTSALGFLGLPLQLYGGRLPVG